jgi:hypothetical protein
VLAVAPYVVRLKSNFFPSASSEDAMILAIKNRHDGRWDDAEQLKE